MSLIVWLLLGATLVGLVLVIRGLRGRRVGDEPRCRKCGYNMTGLTGEQCPECGSPTSGKNVVIGTRRRRRPSLAVGGTLLLVSLTVLGLGIYGRARGVNWYPYYPTFALISKAKQDDRLAIDELTRRCKNGRLSSARASDLIPIALDGQGAKASAKPVWSWTHFLAAMDNRRVLTREQAERFYDQIVTVEIKVRPRVRYGDDVMVSFAYWVRGDPSLTGDFQILPGELRVGDVWRQPVHFEPSGSLSMPGSGGSSGYSMPPGLLEPGVYTVECLVTKRLLCWNDTDWSNPSFKRQVKLTAEFEVLAPDAPSDVRLVKDSSLAEEIKKAMAIRITDNPWNEAEPDDYLCIHVTVTGALPIDCAFDVIGLDGERELELGTITIRKQPAGSGAHVHSTQMAVQDIEADTIIPILRTNPEVARRTTDIFEIWEGELRFDPVPVERSRQ